MAETARRNYFLINAPDINQSQRQKHAPVHMEQNEPLTQKGYYGG